LEEDEFWYVGEGPPEWQALNQEFNRVVDEIMAETFLRNSELELAMNPAVEDDALFEQGRLLVFPPEPDAPSPPG